MKIAIPEFCLVVLIGARHALRATFANQHFSPEEILSVGASAPDASAFSETLEAAQQRLSARHLTVVDLGNRPKEQRAALVHLAKLTHALPVAIVIEPLEGKSQLRRAANLPRLDRDGFRAVHVLDTAETIAAAAIERLPIPTDMRHLAGAFDIIGDVHGCADELKALLARLGYQLTWYREAGEIQVDVRPPSGRRAVFPGDLADRGPNSPDVLRIIMRMVETGAGLCVLGNHDAKLLRWLEGRSIRPTHGFDRTIAQLQNESEAFRQRVRDFVDGLQSHYWLDGGHLVVVHAGIRADMIGRVSEDVREYCLYGETTGEIDRFGYPVRTDWARGYDGDVAVVYGHTPMRQVAWVGNTLCVDTGCVFGGALTAVRWPERELVSVPATQVHWGPREAN